MTRRVAILLAAVLVLVGCDAGGQTSHPGRLGVVTTTTVFADLIARVGGDAVDVASLVPKGGEVHTFDPSPADVTRIAAADLMIVNGLGLDDWLARLARDAGTTAPTIKLGEDLGGVEYLAGEEEGEAINPHLWLNVAYARAYVERIGGALADADPAHATAYRANATAYGAELESLDRDIRTKIDAIRPANRKIVSFHEAFPYFAEAYGLEIVGVVVDAPGQDPSAGEIADLVDAIRASGVKAVLGEAQFSDKLVRTIAEESGARVESRIYSDSIGDAPADSYVGMMRWNADRIVEALR